MSIFFAVPVLAQTLNIDLSELDPELSARILAAQKAAAEKSKLEAAAEVVPSAESVEGWVDLGEKIARVIATVCKELSVEVNEFVQTPVGKMTMFLIIWKILGAEVLSFIVGLIFLVLGLSTIVWSFKRFHVRERVYKDSEGKIVSKKKDASEVEFVSPYEFDAKEARLTSACFHVGFAALLVLVCLTVMIP